MPGELLWQNLTNTHPGARASCNFYMNVGLYMSRTRAFPPFIALRPRRFARAEVQPGAEVASSGLSTNHPSAAKPTIKPPRRQGGNPCSPTPRRHPRPCLGKIDRPNYFATSVVPQVHDLGAHVCTTLKRLFCLFVQLRGTVTNGQGPAARLCRSTGRRPAATAKLEPRLWTSLAVRHIHCQPRVTETPPARSADGASLWPAVVYATNRVKDQELRQKFLLFAQVRLLGRDDAVKLLWLR